MDNLSIDEIYNIIGYTDTLPSSNRVNSTFRGAYRMNRNDILQYLNEQYPFWDENNTELIELNRMALNDRWDLILFVLNETGCILRTILLQITHLFERDDIAKRIVEKCGLSTDSIQEIYYMWLFDHTDKEIGIQRLMRNIRSNSIIVKDIIGYITPEMRQYIINEYIVHDITLRNSDFGIYILGSQDNKIFSTDTLTFLDTTTLFLYGPLTYERIVATNVIPQDDIVMYLSMSQFVTQDIIDSFKNTYQGEKFSYVNPILAMKYPDALDIPAINNISKNNLSVGYIQILRDYNLYT